jgi:tetratricopeptide (TPR) repeat protein
MTKQKRRAARRENALGSPLFSSFSGLAPTLIITLVVVLITYLPALSAQALYLDDDVYLGSPLIQNPSLSSVGRFFGEVIEPSAVFGYYHPLTLTSVMLDFLDPGVAQSPLPFHRTSLLLHLLNTGLVIIFLYMLFGNKVVAGLVGLLFGLHPINADNILWIAERKTVLATFFVLLSLIFYVLYTRRPDWKRYAATWAMYVCALLSKPTAIPLPVLFLVLDYWPLGRLNLAEIFAVWRNWRTLMAEKPLWLRILIEKIPFLIVGALSAVIAYVSQERTVGPALPVENPQLRQVLSLVYKPVFYIFKMIWPTNLIVEYPFPTPLTLANPVIWAGIIGTIVLIVALVIAARRAPPVLAGGLFFFIAIFPALLNFNAEMAGNRFVYLPMIGLLLPIAWALNLAWNAALNPSALSKRRNIILAAGAVVLVLAMSLTVAYEAHWQSTVGLLQYLIVQTPEQWKLHGNLGGEYLHTDKIDLSIAEYKEAIRLAPDRPENYLNLGKVWYQTGNYPAAQEEFTYVLQKEPNLWSVHLLLGMTLMARGNPETAIKELNEADRIHPGEAEIYFNLGEAFNKQGKFTEAAHEYRETLRVNPDYHEAQDALDKLPKGTT